MEISQLKERIANQHQELLWSSKNRRGGAHVQRARRAAERWPKTETGADRENRVGGTDLGVQSIWLFVMYNKVLMGFLERVPGLCQRNLYIPH